MLDLEELKRALEHDFAQRGYPPPLPDYADARRLMVDAVLAIEEASIVLRDQPKDVADAVDTIESAINKLTAATRALSGTKGATE